MGKYSCFIKKIFIRLNWRAKILIGTAVSDLEMIWPEKKFTTFPDIAVVPVGYTLRQFNASDKDKYFALLESSGITSCSLDYWEKHILPEGFFVVEHNETGALVATCMASHHPTIRHRRAGNLGWLAVDPKHRGRQLGCLVSAAVTARLLEGGYRRLYLGTQDFRYAAIKIYLKLGWVPLLYQKDMYKRWEAICEKLLWNFTPMDYPTN